MMNISELASQIYNFSIAIPSHSKMKRKSKNYFRELGCIKSKFAEADLHHPCVEHLTSLLYAYNRNILHMKMYGYDPVYRNNLKQNNLELENSIKRTIQVCNDYILSHNNMIYRHSF